MSFHLLFLMIIITITKIVTLIIPTILLLIPVTITHRHITVIGREGRGEAEEIRSKDS